MLIQVTKQLKENSRTLWKPTKRSAILRNGVNMMNFGRTINNGSSGVDVEITIMTDGSLILVEGVEAVVHKLCLQNISLRCLVALEDLVVGAVSYTHLRAHETRHDLVCRLL